MRLRPVPLLGAILVAAGLATWLVVANLPSPEPAAAARGAGSRPATAAAPAGRLEGIVRTSDGRPQAGAAVIAASAAYGASATTGVDGRFVLEVPAGSWRVHATLGDRAAAVDPVTVTPGATGKGVELRLAPAAEIRGEAIHARSGRPAAGARAVALAHDGGEVLARATADASGRFRLGPLPEGPVDVRVAAEGASPALLVGVTLEAGARFPLRVALDAAGSAAGIVRDAGGRPLAGVAVRVVPDADLAQASEVRTDFEGRWRIQALPAGPAELTARHEGALPGAARAIRVVPLRETRVEVELAEAGLLSGQVVQGGKPPPPGTSVVATPRRPGARPTEAARVDTDAAGHYELALPAGEYRVAVAPRDPRAGDLRGRPGFTRIEAGRTSVLDLEVGRAAADEAVEILVLEPGGAPSPGAAVTLSRPGDAAVAFAASAGEDGRVPIERELGAAGKAVVVRARNGGRTGSATLVLPERGTVPVALAPGAAVTGVVRGRGRPVDVITVEAASEPERGAWRTLDVSRFAGARFALRDLPAGTLRISVRTADGRRGDASLRLAAGEVRAVEIALAPPAAR
jgi:hypothetical protein